MRGGLVKGALQQVKVPQGGERKKSRKAEAEGRPARRMGEREGEGWASQEVRVREREQKPSRAQQQLPTAWLW